jgi:nucleoside-diphosphate-sugar epimerase
VGVQSRNFSHARIESLGWRPKVSLAEGLQLTYEWIEEQVRRHASGVLTGAR